MSDSPGSSLELLLDEREIHSVLASYCRAMDRADLLLLTSVFAQQARIEHGPFVGDAAGFSELIREMSVPTSPYRSTHHMIGNVTISFDEPLGANTETYFHAVHCREDGSGRYDEFVGGRYLDRFAKMKGQWQIAHRRTVFDWSRIEKGTRTFWEQVGVPGFIFGARDRSDPSYKR